MISDESDRFNPRDPKPADAGKPSKSAKRREARQLATQALYQWHMARQSLNEIEAQFRVDNDFTLPKNFVGCRFCVYDSSDTWR